MSVKVPCAVFSSTMLSGQNSSIFPLVSKGRLPLYCHHAEWCQGEILPSPIISCDISLGDRPIPQYPAGLVVLRAQMHIFPFIV